MRISHTLSIILAVILCCSPAGAQSIFNQGQKPMTKAQLTALRAALQAQVDSLSTLVDSLRYKAERADSLENELKELTKPKPYPVYEAYTAEKADSIINEWYQSELPEISEYSGNEDLDSIRFSSNVSDSVFIERLTRMNSFITLPFNPTVKNYMILYSEKMPAKMAEIIGLSNYYFPIFEEIFDRYDLPLELKYMAVIESAMDPVARSRAGARGMWQFMYKTGRHYGLKIDSFMDERLDVEKAADAAARYLKDAYSVFGDWCLAISSYNCGLGNVNKAIRRSGSRDFWSIYPYLPRETRGYMPAFVGAMYAMTYFKEYGIIPKETQLPAFTDTFEIRKNLHFKQLNEIIGVPVEDIRYLNPQYTHDIIPGDGGVCTLRLPYNFSNAFLEAQDTLYTHRADTLLSKTVLKNIADGGDGESIRYKIKNGDSLGRIAARHHVTVAQLKKWNHLRSDNIRAGQYLVIYRGGGTSK